MYLDDADGHPCWVIEFEDRLLYRLVANPLDPDHDHRPSFDGLWVVADAKPGACCDGPCAAANFLSVLTCVAGEVPVAPHMTRVCKEVPTTADAHASAVPTNSSTGMFGSV
jgi:hypothetical protein